MIETTFMLVTLACMTGCDNVDNVIPYEESHVALYGEWWLIGWNHEGIWGAEGSGTFAPLPVVPSMMMAQLSVLSNGKVFIKDGTLSSNANLTVSDAPYLGFISDDINANVGTRSQGYTTSTNSSIGVLGEGYIQVRYCN